MFMQKGDAFLAAEGEPHQVLPAGFYNWNQTSMGMFFNRKRPQEEKHEPYPYQKVVLDQLRTFLGLREGYARLGLTYKRGFLLHGGPGCGKTALARMAAQEWVANGGIVLEGGCQEELAAAVKIANSNVLVLIDDVDGWGDRHLTHLMDGVDDFSSVCWLTTTNHIDRISQRLQRPGRFDEVLEVVPPPPGDLTKWVMALDIPQDQKDLIVSKSEGKTPSEVREMVIRVHLLNKPI